MTTNSNPRPDARERAFLDAEANAERAQRAREGRREATPEKWDRLNDESNARGDGDLPF